MQSEHFRGLFNSLFKQFLCLRYLADSLFVNPVGRDALSVSLLADENRFASSNGHGILLTFRHLKPKSVIDHVDSLKPDSALCRRRDTVLDRHRLKFFLRGVELVRDLIQAGERFFVDSVLPNSQVIAVKLSN